VFDAGLFTVASAACKEIGEAAQTLGAVIRLVNIMDALRPSPSVRIIADVAMMEGAHRQATLAVCVSEGWLEHCGRDLLANSDVSSAPDREIPLTDKPRATFGFNPFPRWAAKQLKTWALRSVYAAVCARHALIDAVKAGGHGARTIAEQMSLNRSSEAPVYRGGLLRTRKRSCAAKQTRMRIEDGGCSDLDPHPEYQVPRTPFQPTVS